MASDSSKWLIGCGIGCGVILMLLVLGGIGSFFLVKDTVSELEEIGESIDQLQREHGRIRDFTPSPDGRIAAERVVAFLAVRERTQSLRSEIAETVTNIEGRISGIEEGGQDWDVWKVLTTVKEGIGAIPKIARFQQARSQALSDNEMGLGEYYYIYVLSYYSWLGKSPGDGPRFLQIGENDNVSWGETEDSDTSEVREERAQQLTRQIRRNFRAFLQNAMRNNPDDASTQNSEWRTAVEKELTALEDQWQRIPWMDGVPVPIEESLAPYRSQMEESYDELNNPFEIISLDNKWNKDWD